MNNPFAYASPDRSERIGRLLFHFLDRAGVTFSADDILELGQLADDICASESLVVDCAACEGTGSFDAPTITGVPARTYAKGTCPRCLGLGRSLTQEGEQVAEVLRLMHAQTIGEGGRK